MRPDGRKPDELRPVEIATGYLKTAEGSALIMIGNTQVLCAASVETSVPPFLRNTGKGWVTAEYAMLPRGDFDQNRARGGEGASERADPRNSAPDRTIASSSDRSERIG